MAQKKRVPKHITPKGLARWAYLNEPDTKFADGDDPGDYKLDLLIPEEEAAPLMKMVQEAAEACYEEATEALKPAKKKQTTIHLPFELDCDDETGEETGMVCFRFKSKAKVKSRKTGRIIDLQPKMFDASGKLITNRPIVGNGSTLKVSFTVGTAWYNAATKSAGTTLRLNAVQILDLVEFGGDASAEQYGFGEEEGYSHEDDFESNGEVNEEEGDF